jgi:hypothetical protein
LQLPGRSRHDCPRSPLPTPVLTLLDAERAHFLAQVARIPTARQAERLAPERWSVVEIVEHVARVDRGVAKLLAIRSAEPRPGDPSGAVGRLR